MSHLHHLALGIIVRAGPAELGGSERLLLEGHSTSALTAADEPPRAARGHSTWARPRGRRRWAKILVVCTAGGSSPLAALNSVTLN